MKKIAIIPARSGSKRIPGKNIRPFLGKPIIAYSIETAIKSELFDEIMVSTDSLEIADIAVRYGAKVPFYRSKKTSDDHAVIVDVITEVLDNYQKEGRSFDCFCCIFPTAPLISVSHIKKGYELLLNGNYDSVFPVVSFSFPIQRALKIEDGKLLMFNPEHRNTRSQDLVPAFHDTGQFYWMQVPEFLNQKTIYSKNSGAIILNELEVQDIDNETDWQMAELKFNLKNKHL